MPPALVERLPPIVQLPFRGQRERKVQPGVPLPPRCTAASSIPASTVIVAFAGVERAHPVHPPERQHELAAVVVRRRAAAQARVAALRHHAVLPRAAQARTTAATSAVDPGRTTARTRPR